MIASIMIYLAAVSVLATTAALVAERGLRGLQLPSRWAWLSALALGPALVLATLFSDFAPRGFRIMRVVTGSLPAEIDIPALIAAVTTPGWRAWLEIGLGLGWGIGAVAITLVLLRGQMNLSHEKRAARAQIVHGELVFVTARRGPAVAGLIDPWIVVPEWVLALPDDQLRMVITHEAEHLNAGDSRTIAAGLGLATLMFWNPLAWLQLRLLRTAMELDCDRRVLVREQDTRIYGTALLAVAAGVTPDRTLGVVAFSENAHSLRTRILAMTRKRARSAGPLGALLLLIATGLVVQACGIESPVAPLGASRNALPAQAAVDGPYFTPFKDAPQLVNRDEVRKSLEDNYPTLLRDAGVEGRADVWLKITELGAVTDIRIARSTGHEALDLAAERVGRAMKFKPARLDDHEVMVWVRVPITFKANPPAAK